MGPRQHLTERERERKTERERERKQERERGRERARESEREREREREREKERERDPCRITKASSRGGRHAQPLQSLPFAKSAAHRDNRREWNVPKQQWNLC